MNDAKMLDAVDRRILRYMQVQGRIGFDALGQKVGLSASATLRRVRRLEEAGVIEGYAAQVSRQKLGLTLSAYVSVRLAKSMGADHLSPGEAFAAAVQTWPEVTECAALTGDMDYLLLVLVRDMAHYSNFIMDNLLKHPAVLDCKTSFMLRTLKSVMALPV